MSRVSYLVVVLCSQFASSLHVVLSNIYDFILNHFVLKISAGLNALIQEIEKKRIPFSFFFQSKPPCCSLVISPSLVLWNITWNIITTHITTRLEMWLHSSEKRIFQSQIWSLLLSAKTCIATNTKGQRAFYCIQVLKRLRHWGTVATLSSFGRERMELYLTRGNSLAIYRKIKTKTTQL